MSVSAPRGGSLRFLHLTAGLLAALWLGGCEEDVCCVQTWHDDAGQSDIDADADDAESDAVADVYVPPKRDLTRDIEHMDLELDLHTRKGVARIRVAPSSEPAMSFEVQGLEVHTIRLDGVALNYIVSDGIADILVPPSETAPVLEIRYDFKQTSDFSFMGWMPSGSTLTWPDSCGNLFPCHSAPADGLTWSLKVNGVPEATVAVNAASVPTPSPAYMVAFAIGKYSWTSLGKTKGGTEVGFWTTADLLADAKTGTANLLKATQWLEDHLGPYAFGPAMGPVAVNWGFQQGGIEQHPFWHVARPAMHDELTQLHEAAHGWFGDSVRLQCWEDLVLSEGLATYLAGRLVEVLHGAEAGEAIFASYGTTLESLVAKGVDPIALPDGCGEKDISGDLLFTKIPYMKGALFLRAVAKQTGAKTLDAALGSFYVAHAGKATRMWALVEHIKAKTGFDAAPLATQWLLEKGIPKA